MFHKFSKPVSMALSCVLIVLLILLDQFTKQLAIAHLMGQEDIILIKGVFQLHYLENNGAAFSILKGQTSFFLIVTPILLIVMLILLYRMPRDSRFSPLCYIIVFIVAGAIGNYIDRINYHYVVDFLYFSLIDFPVFNVADCYVTCSVFLLIFMILFYYKDEDFDNLKQQILGR